MIRANNIAKNFFIALPPFVIAFGPDFLQTVSGTGIIAGDFPDSSVETSSSGPSFPAIRQGRKRSCKIDLNLLPPQPARCGCGPGRCSFCYKLYTVVYRFLRNKLHGLQHFLFPAPPRPPAMERFFG
jgi:hypothetical protein